MNNIPVLLLFDDIRDRFATLALSTNTPPSVYRRIATPRRVYSAIEEAVQRFVGTMPASVLQGFIETVFPINGELVNTVVKRYSYPQNAAHNRPDHGLLFVIVDGEDQVVVLAQSDMELQTHINSIMAASSNTLLQHEGLKTHVADSRTRFVYVKNESTLGYRYIAAPEPFNYSDITASGEYPNIPQEIPIDISFMNALAIDAVQALVRMAAPPQQPEPAEPVTTNE